MTRRSRRTLLVVAAVLLFVAVAIFLRAKAPPEAARLLPESDGIIYINLKPLRAFLHLNLKPVKRAPDYQQFINATGVNWERDLDEVAIALHRMPNPNGPNGPVAYSMVLVGRITGKKMNAWLAAHATSREYYAGNTIYNIPSQGRTVRVAQIGYNMLAVSNTPTPEQIHSIIDRHRTAALPFAGSTLLARHYKDVPLLSLAWGMGQIGLPFAQSGKITIFGFRLPLQVDSTIIASLHWAGSLRLRIEEIAPSEQAAANQVAALSTFLTLAKAVTAPLASNETNNGLKEMLTSAEISRKRNHLVITSTVSPSFFAGLMQAENSSAAASTP